MVEDFIYNKKYMKITNLCEFITNDWAFEIERNQTRIVGELR